MNNIKKFKQVFVVWFMSKINSNKENLSKIFLGTSLCLFITVVLEFKMRTKILPNTSPDSLDNIINEFGTANRFEIFFLAISLQVLLISIFSIFQNKSKLVFAVSSTIFFVFADFVSFYITVRSGKMNIFTTCLLFGSLLLILYISYQFLVFLRVWVQDEEDGNKKINIPKLTFLWTVLFALIGLLIKKS